VVAGAPAKVVATRDNSKANLFNSVFYQLSAANYAKGLDRLSTEDLKSLAALASAVR
jgi:hypothetical protein